MAQSTVPALFRFQVSNHTDTTSAEPTYIEHTHPVPSFLTQPTPSQQGSKEFTSAFIDVISLITHQHHAECMQAITTPCIKCGKPATDALKSPMSYLHLAEPMVIIHVTPFCGNSHCEREVRAKWLQIQNRVMKSNVEETWSGNSWGKMGCAVCGKEDAKRCAGCGMTAYCGKECQRAGWKKHKRFCQRKGLGQDLEGMKGPVEMI